jgi:hypothetical protein
MTEQGNLFQSKAGKHTALLKRRTRSADFRRKVRIVLECFEPSEKRDKKHESR